MFKKIFGLGKKSEEGPSATSGVRIQKKGADKMRATAAALPPVPPMPDFSAPQSRQEPSRAETQALLRDALAQAERELDERKDRDRRDPSGAAQRQDKQALITAAMAVRRMKQNVLNDLDPQTRAKLKHFAETTMGVGKPPKKPS